MFNNKLVVTLIITIALAGIYISITSTKQTAPQLPDYFQARITLSSQPSVGSNVNLTLVIKPIFDAMNTKVTFFLPDQVTLPEGSTRCKAALNEITKGGKSSLSVPLKVTATGEWAIEVFIASNPPEGATISRSYFLCGRTINSTGEVLPCSPNPASSVSQQESQTEQGEIPIEKCPKSSI